MPSRQDHLHSYQFATQRVVAALVMARDGPRASSPFRRAAGATVARRAGGAIALGCLAAYGAITGPGGTRCVTSRPSYRAGVGAGTSTRREIAPGAQLHLGAAGRRVVGAADPCWSAPLHRGRAARRHAGHPGSGPIPCRPPTGCSVHRGRCARHVVGGGPRSTLARRWRAARGNALGSRRCSPGIRTGPCTCSGATAATWCASRGRH